MTIIISYLFAFIILAHGLVHTLGFLTAFGYVSRHEDEKEISKQTGLAWLLASLIFLITAILLLQTQPLWLLFSLFAILISQILILNSWKGAKWGTMLNSLILIVSVIGIADWSFNRMVKKEVAQLLNVPVQEKIISIDMISDLPPVVQRWLTNAGIVGKSNIYNAAIKQKGSLRTKSSGKWMKFKATEYFTTDIPAFNWQVKADMMPMLFMNGRDKYYHGNGEMLIKLLSLKTLVNAKPSSEMNKGTMLRYLSEICWVPTAALSDYIEWEPINDSSARAIMTYNDSRVSGIFYFTKGADIKAFEALRYGNFDGVMSLEKWHIESKDFKVFNGIRIPSRSEVTWKLDDGDFTWLKLELETVAYNSNNFDKDSCCMIKDK